MKSKNKNTAECKDLSGQIKSITFVPMQFKGKTMSEYIELIMVQVANHHIETGKSPDSIVMHPDLLKFMFDQWSNSVVTEYDYDDISQLKIMNMHVIRSKDIKKDRVSVINQFL
jgi:hypothetical protein